MWYMLSNKDDTFRNRLKALLQNLVPSRQYLLFDSVRNENLSYATLKVFLAPRKPYVPSPYHRWLGEAKEHKARVYLEQAVLDNVFVRALLFDDVSYEVTEFRLWLARYETIEWWLSQATESMRSDVPAILTRLLHGMRPRKQIWLYLSMNKILNNEYKLLVLKPFLSAPTFASMEDTDSWSEAVEEEEQVRNHLHQLIQKDLSSSDRQSWHHRYQPE